MPQELLLKVGGGLCTLSQGTAGGRGQAAGEREGDQPVPVLTLKACPRKPLSPEQIRTVCLGMSKF